MGDNYRFAESDSLLCYHGPMLYEAKCLKRRKANDGKAQYFIHYKGWNSKWEEWVDDNRVLAVNNANMNKMASLKEIHSNAKKSGVKRSITVVKEETVRNVVTPPTKGKKRKYSEISSELNQTVNVQSPMESKPKKRGRPPKIKEIEATKSVDTTESIKSVDTTESIKSVDTTERTNSLDTTEATTSVDTTEATKSLDTTEAKNALYTTETAEIDSAVSIEENKVTDKTIEESEETKEVDPAKEEYNTKEDEVIKAIDEATQKNETTKEVSDTIKVEGIEGVKDTTVIESTEEEEAKTKTGDDKIKEIEEVEEGTEALEEIKAIEESEIVEGSESVEGFESVEESEIVEGSESVEGFESVEESETVERTEDIEETVTAEGFDTVKGSEGDDVEGEEFEGDELEGEELEDEEFEDEELEEEELEDEELEGEESEGEDLESEELEGEEFEDEDFEEQEDTEEYESLYDEEIVTDEEFDYIEDFVTDEESETNNESEDDRIKRYNSIKAYGPKNVPLRPLTSTYIEDVIFTAPAPVVKLDIPPKIRRRIAHDNFQIMKNNKLLKFPKTITVQYLVQAFMDSNVNYLAKRDNIDIGRTMIQYFNLIIHEKLFYPPENAYKMQKKAVDCLKTKIYNNEDIIFNNTLYPRQLWHIVYGPTYLLRLFIQFPYFVSTYVYPEVFTTFFVIQFEDFMAFIEDNFDKFFSNEEYVEADDKDERMDCEFYKNLMTLLNNKQITNK